MDYPKLISEKWNLTAKFNCLQAIYFDAPIALAVPMLGQSEVNFFFFKPLNNGQNISYLDRKCPQLHRKATSVPLG